MIQNLEKCKRDGDYFRTQLGTDRGFLITFDLYTEESIEAGDTEDEGYDGAESMEPDEFDIEDNVTAVDKAIRYLTRDHCVEASGSGFYPDRWYSDCDGDTDYRSGDETRHSYHPTNFTPEEQRAIFDAVKASRQ
jgi:hypothetical protein